MSEDSDWQPSRDEYMIIDDDEDYEKSTRKQKSSKKRQKNDNVKKQTFGQEQSTERQRIDESKRYDTEPQQGTSKDPTFLMDIANENTKKHHSKKIRKSEDYIPPNKKNDNVKKQTFGQEQSMEKQRIDESKRYDTEPQQGTSKEPTFLMDIANENPKKHQSKKIRKSEDYIPPNKKQKKTEVEIEIPKHILTVMAQQLQEKHVDKSHVQPQKLDKWKGTTAERKKMAVIYNLLPEKLKNLMWQNIKLTDEEKVIVEGKMVKGSDGSFNCTDCNDKCFFKRREIYRHLRICHSNAPIVHVCGYDHCPIATNNTTILGVHTVYQHFRHLFKDIDIPV